ncbi:RagB/SusD family nutrient uptake outer membrane protein [Reichenbachiella sp. MALMAid0571]|uniref:RagB/SusD family nutrient uptake outer membrane protein n=1 Tax=Reichenbachiella sp. MALMAid0571 TaxID=3143939 RepID=UPI0032E04140
MKSIYKIVSIAICMSCLSCSDDFLDKSDPTRLNAGTFYQTEEQFDQAVNALYGGLQTIISNQWQFGEFISDNTTLHYNVENRGNGPGLETLEYWQYIEGTSNVQSLYESLYQQLVNVNTVLQRLPGADINENAKSGFEGQAKFIRAYLYFQLVQHFGDVILLTEPIDEPSVAWTYARSPASDVYAQIESDLTDAASVLPPTLDASDIGRVSKGAALSLLGKVYLTRKNYGSAVTTLQQVLTLGYDLLDDYYDVFDPDMKNHAESIFDVQFQGDNDLGEQSGFTYNFYPRQSDGLVIPFPGVSGGGWNIPSLDMIAAYEEDDLRKDVSLAEGYFDQDDNWVAIPFIKKYYHDHSIQDRPDDNWPVIRYSDVLLMLAEAINEESGPGSAYTHLNKVRKRAGLDELDGLTKESFRTAVLKERRVELAFENHRWFDLKRTHTPDELATFLNAYGEIEKANPTTSRGGFGFTSAEYSFQPHEYLFPIPASERLINKELTQNQGYQQ